MNAPGTGEIVAFALLRSRTDDDDPSRDRHPLTDLPRTFGGLLKLSVHEPVPVSGFESSLAALVETTWRDRASLEALLARRGLDPGSLLFENEGAVLSIGSAPLYVGSKTVIFTQ